jgi:hypothetical protein
MDLSNIFMNSRKMQFQNVLVTVIAIWLKHVEKLSVYARQLFNISQHKSLTSTANLQCRWIIPKCMASILPAKSVFTRSATFTELSAISNLNNSKWLPFLVLEYWVIYEVALGSQYIRRVYISISSYIGRYDFNILSGHSSEVFC